MIFHLNRSEKHSPTYIFVLNLKTKSQKYSGSNRPCYKRGSGGTSVLSLLGCSFSHCSFHCWIVCLACDSSIVATCLSIQLPALLLCLYFMRFVFDVRSCFSGEPKQN